MARDILLVDRYLTTRALLRHYLRAEISDCHLQESTSLEEGWPLVQSCKMQLAILSDRLFGLEHANRTKDLPEMPKLYAQRLPCLVILSHNQTSHVASLRQMGFLHHLATPFTSSQLAEKVELLAPARQLRGAPRFHLPQTTALLQGTNLTLSASVVNISRSGLLLELPVPDSPPPWSALHPLTLSLTFPPQLELLPLEQLACQLVGFKIIQWDEAQRPLLLRLEVRLLQMLPCNLEALAHRLLLVEP